MANPSGLSRHNHFSEFNSPLPTAAGVLSPAARKVLAMENLMSLEADAAVTGTAAAVAGMTMETFFDGNRYTSRFTFSAVDIGTQGDNASLASGLKIFDFPAGPAIQVVGGRMNGTLLGTGSVLTDTPEIGLGTTIASGEQATLGAVAATAEDLLGPFVAASVNNGAAIGQGVASGPKSIAAGGTKTVHINIADGWADVTAAGNVLFTGVVELHWYKD